MLLAISTPGDIVLDVARAVEPSELQAARTDLVRRAGAPASAAMAFDVPGAVSAGISKQAVESPERESFRKFESVVLQTFIQNMMPKEAEAVYGSGTSGEMWKSMMAEHMADAVSQRGGIGIADRLLADRYQDGEKTLPIGPISSAAGRVDLDRSEALTRSFLDDFQRRTMQVMVGKPEDKDKNAG